MSIPQSPSPLSNILAAKTYNAAWFSGSTKEAQITAAIAAAVTDGALYVFVPSNMLPYTSSQVTFNYKVTMLCEGGNPESLDARAYGVPTDGITDGQPALNALANVLLQATGLFAVVNIIGTVRISSNLTLPANIRIRFVAGMFSLDTGVTVTINGPFDAGLYQVFTGLGANSPIGAVAPRTTGVRFGPGTITAIYPHWWGGDPRSLANDDTPAIQSAVDAAQSPNIANSKPTTKVCLEARGEWLVTGVVVISNPYILIDGGNGWLNTNVRFETLGAIAGTCFRFEGPHVGQPLYGCGIRGITFVSGNSSYKKIAVDCVDVSSFIYERITSPGWNGAKSTMLRYAGRDLARIRDISLYADRPIEIIANTQAPTLALDHCHITDTEIIAQDALEYCITIQDNVALANLTVDGRNAWGAGKGGLFYVPTASPATELVVELRNVRYETPATNGFFAIEWGSAAVVTRNFSALGCNFGGSGAATNNGLKLRGVFSATVINSIYTGLAVPLDIDASVHDYMQINFTQIGGTPSIVGQNKVFELNNAGAYAMSPTSFYTNATDVTNPVTRMLSVVMTPQSTPANLQDGMMYARTDGMAGRVNGQAAGEIPLARISADRGDTSPTIVAGTDAPTQLFASALGANRTITLGTPAAPGARFRVVRTGLGAFTLSVGGLKVIPNSTAAFVDVEYSGPLAAWILTGYGLL